MLALGKRAFRIPTQKAVGPDKRSLFSACSQNSKSISHLPAAMVLLLVSITVLHLVTLAMLLIATLEKVRQFPPDGSRADFRRWRTSSGPFFLSGFHHSVCVLSSVLQSWWVWSDSEITDLWYNCFHDNITDTWLCAASTENGRSLTRGCLGGCSKPSEEAGNVTGGVLPKSFSKIKRETRSFKLLIVLRVLTLVLRPPPPDWLQSIQGLMVLSVVFSSISFLVFLVQLLALSKRQVFYFTGLCQAFAGL